MYRHHNKHLFQQDQLKNPLVFINASSFTEETLDLKKLCFKPLKHELLLNFHDPLLLFPLLFLPKLEKMKSLHTLQAPNHHPPSADCSFAPCFLPLLSGISRCLSSLSRCCQKKSTEPTQNIIGFTSQW